MNTKYVLITPAHNEEKFIQNTIKSVLAQTILPKIWLIMDDGSTDRTGEIIKEYEEKYEFIITHKVDQTNEKSYYGRKSYVVALGYDIIKSYGYSFIANLDADLTIESTYYENILTEFDKNPKLGVASGIYLNKNGENIQKTVRDPDQISTAGGLQVFRRECFEMVGGYQCLETGGEDTLAGIKARMNGWQTKYFPQYIAIHYRPVGTGSGIHPLVAKYRDGQTDYNLGAHPIFEIAKLIHRFFSEKPVILASLARLAGFLGRYLSNYERNVSDDVVEYFRKEQINRLKCWGHKIIGIFQKRTGIKVF